MFIRISGHPKPLFLAKAASTAFNIGDLVYPNGSGYVIPADSTSGTHLGVCQEYVAATDTDYTGTRKIMIDEAGEDDIFEATVAGTLTAAMVGNYYDLSNAYTVNAAAQAKSVVLCVGFISATKGLFKITAKAQDHYVATT